MYAVKRDTLNSKAKTGLKKKAEKETQHEKDK